MGLICTVCGEDALFLVEGRCPKCRGKKVKKFYVPKAKGTFLSGVIKCPVCGNNVYRSGVGRLAMHKDSDGNTCKAIGKVFK